MVGDESREQKTKSAARGSLFRAKGGWGAEPGRILTHGKRYFHKQWVGVSRETAQSLEARNKDQGGTDAGAGASGCWRAAALFFH